MNNQTIHIESNKLLRKQYNISKICRQFIFLSSKNFVKNIESDLPNVDKTTNSGRFKFKINKLAEKPHKSAAQVSLLDFLVCEQVRALAFDDGLTVLNNVSIVTEF